MKSWSKAAAWAAFALGMGASAAQAQIVIGQTAGFSGVVAAGVQETTDGAKLYLDSVNARGGVNGQKIELLSMDDKFDPKLAGENARTLIEEKHVTAMFLTRGTPHNEAIVPHLNKHGVALIAPSTGAMVLHKPLQKNVFNVRATYQREAEKAITHLASLGISRIGVIATDDSFGADGLAGAKRGFELSKMTPVVLEKVDRAKPEFGPIAAKIAQANAQAVLILASGNTVVDGYNAYRKAGSGAQLVTLSNNASSGFVKSLGENARGVIVTQVFPSERAGNSPLVREALDLAKAKGKEVSPAMLEGYAAAKVLVEALRRAGPKPTRDKIGPALESMQKFDIGGLEVSYSADDHTGLDFADLSIVGTDGKFRR
ncbi:ABC transporter substrate-binding protein [Diaphorobacter sp. HDW4B]|uniref:ABC transporter substrate-binding protein n=1 Tax=Diaphorobacter sp. HDW4B TaxID=2714925 RepID=UPI00140ADCDF|nr:ABC transporter substrate-binding protein [Diaphorobacter sp. HDW4B]QIL71486.1 ABC transporter substrate-binding protein [Diaphorobacter sp. HDW4B]